MLFAAVQNFPKEYEPAVEDMFKSAAFMYSQRQRMSVTGRPGLGDSVAEMAQYTLAQVSRTGSRARASTRSKHAHTKHARRVSMSTVPVAY